MTTLNLSINHICAGGGHVRIAVAVDGGATRLVNLNTPDLTQPITQDDIESALLVILRLYFKGKSPSVARAALNAGVVITL